jgi:hypothetical protein
MRLIVGTLTAVGLLFASPAVAQAGIKVGMQVTDATGAPVGMIKAIQGTNVLIQTGRHEALLPSASFTASNGKLLFGMTQAQLDAEIEKNLSAANAAIVTGATVRGLGGTQVGTIDSVAEGKATITLQDGKKIAVPETGLRGNPDGTVTIGYSADQLEALLKATGSTAGASSTDTATTNTPGN